jgi:hypothetical protein
VGIFVHSGLDRVRACFSSVPPDAGQRQGSVGNASPGRRSMTRPWRRLAGIQAAVLLLGVTQACGPSVVALDTLANSASRAENLAYSVATQADCGSFEGLDLVGTRETWRFTCQRSTVSYDIVVFGSDDARRAGLRSLLDAGMTYAAKGYYAVIVAPSGATKEEALRASPSQTLLDPFR